MGPQRQLPLSRYSCSLKAKRALDQYNELEFPTTWCPFANDWVPWMMPMRVLKGTRQLVRVAASGYHKSSSRTWSTAQSEYVTTTEEWETHLAGLHRFDDDDDDQEDHCESRTSQISPSSTSEDDVEEYLLHGDPRMPSPRDLAAVFGSGPLKPFFCDRVALARKTVDVALINDTTTAHQAGTYEAQPELHPLAEKPPHAVMALYDERNMSAGSLSRVFSNLEHIDTHLGRAMREFNSPSVYLNFHGVACGTTTFLVNVVNVSSASRVTILILSTIAVLWRRRWIKSPPHTGALRSLPARTYPPGYQVPITVDFLYTPTGLLLLSGILGWRSSGRVDVIVDFGSEMLLDLLAVYTTATVTYSYPASILSQVPYTSQDFVGEYIFRPLIVNGLEHRGFMQNYFGEPRASLAKNQWSLIKTVESFPILEPGQLGPKHTRRTLPPPPNYRCRASIGVQTTEHLPEVHETTLVPVPMQPTPMEPAQDDSDYPVIFVSDLEQTALQALAAGECLTKVEQRQIFKTCTLCNSIVFVRLYNEHVQGCDGGGVFRSLRSRDN
ncbi:hypothetical protein C8F04DRAFT_1396451 [Mycena alexandri]|uniref:Uncharacterized protein n=1 Tax=Mycena alexandri TaxID=1745969 RepID=A0AAD6SSC1_9AGAR|nr:hypothetical protein C8F04DRAFT_1396451 [Mycena alexandri]